MKGIVCAVVPDQNQGINRVLATVLFAVAGTGSFCFWLTFRWTGILVPLSAILGLAAFVTALSGILHPVRIEFNGPKLSVFYRNRFRYYNLDDLTELRPATFWQRFKLLSNRPAYRLKFSDGRTLVLPDESVKNGELGIALSQWAPTVLKEQSKVTFPFASKGTRANLWAALIGAWIGVCLLFLLFDKGHTSGIVTNMPIWLIFVAQSRNSRKIELHETFLRVFQSTKGVTFDYDRVESINIRHDDHGHELMTVKGIEDAVTFTRTSRDSDYPAVRDFLLKRCVNARLIGLHAPDDLILCSLKPIVEPEPESNHRINLTPPPQLQSNNPNKTVTT